MLLKEKIISIIKKITKRWSKIRLFQIIPFNRGVSCTVLTYITHMWTNGSLIFILNILH